MRLYLDFIEGPIQGKKLNLSEDVSIGRKGAEVEVPDPKLSGIHAFFKYDPSVGWSVVDNQSRNGVWVNGLKEVRFVLRDGDTVQIGSSQIRCRMVEPGAYKISNRFLLFLESLIKKGRNKKVSVVPVKPEMRLKVVQGIQYGQTWDVFFGPRFAGRDNLDICLYDDKAPKDAFRIEVKGSYPYFSTDNEKIVKINDQKLKNKQFAPGDVITIGESKILVEFDEGHGFST